LTTVITRLARPASWAAILLLALLSLLPKDEMIRTGAAGWMEHFVAYAGTMLLCATGYAGLVGLVRPGLALTAYAAILEIGQHFSPGRSPAFVDFAAGAAGVIVAGIFHLALARYRGSR
jgi:VanZ family protein